MGDGLVLSAPDSVHPLPNLVFGVPHCGRSSILFGGLFMREVFSFRSVVIEGSYGKGKTVLSFAIADALLQCRLVDKVVCNVILNRSKPVSFYDCYEYDSLRRLGAIPPMKTFDVDSYNLQLSAMWGGAVPSLRLADEGAFIYDACVIYDESHTALGRYGSVDKAAFSAMTSYLRKRNLVCVFPSCLPLHPVLQRLVVRRVFNLFVFGLPFWVFRWVVPELKERGKDFGGYFLINPTPYFGLSNTFFEPPPVFDNLLVDSLLSGVAVTGRKRGASEGVYVDSQPAYSVWGE